jgi:hypothetical protein
MKKLLIIGAAIMVVAAISPANAQSWAAYNTLGKTYPRNYAEPCWSAAVSKCGREQRAQNRQQNRVQTPAPGCDAVCQRKCQSNWMALGFSSVGACTARWATLNNNGTARACQAAIVSNGYARIPGC